MKYLIFFVFFLSSLMGAGYYLYNYDKKRETTFEKAQNQDPKPNQYEAPEHLTPDFWKKVTPEILKEKLKTIKNINETRQDTKQSMLHLLITYGQYPEMVKNLMDAGIDYNLLHNLPDDEDGNQLTALQTSFFNYLSDKTQPITLLQFSLEIIKHSTEVNQVGFIHGYKTTALLFAAFSRRIPLNIVKSLLEKGADPNFNSEGLTPLSTGFLIEEADIPSLELFDLLIKYGADIDITNNELKTKVYNYMNQHEKLKNTDLFKKLSK